MAVRLLPLTARKGDFIAISFVRLTGIKDKSRLAVEAYVLATVLAPPRSAKSGKGMGGTEGGAGRRRPTEIGDGKDNAELCCFYGRFY